MSRSRGKRGGKDRLKVFRLMLVGSPEVGKTCFCSVFAAHTFFEVYDHTFEVKYYLKDVRSDTLATYEKMPDHFSDIYLEDGDGARQKTATSHKSGEKGKKKRGKKKKNLSRYGIQLADVPGEIQTDLVPLSEEYEAIERLQPSPVTYSATHHDKTKAEQARGQHRVQKNRLYDITLPHGYIIMFDIQNDNSWAKAKYLLKHIRGKRDLSITQPLVLFGNKCDNLKSEEEFGKEMRSKEKEIKSFKLPKVNICFGSVKRNEIRWREEDLTIDQMIHKLVSEIHAVGGGSTGNEDMRKRKKQKDRDKRPEDDVTGNDDAEEGETESGGWCSGCPFM